MSKTATKRAAKRFRREKRKNKGDTWACSNCSNSLPLNRHPNGQRCPELKRPEWRGTLA